MGNELSEQSAVQVTAVQTGRLGSLDGLRGLAALVVMLYHFTLMFPSISRATGIDGDHAAPGSVVWWLTSTPVNLLIAGPSAVLVFFVLSGLVVTLPVLRNRSFDWIAYFPQRTARLGLPAFVSIFVALVFAVIGNAFAGAPSGSMATAWSVRGFEWSTFVQSSDLLLGMPLINNPLWTLKYELVFSIALPIFVIVAMAAKKYWAITILLCSIMSFVGRLNATDGFVFLPIFMIGCVMAVHLGSMRSWAAEPSSAVLIRWAAPCLLLISVVLLTLHANVWSVLPDKGRMQEWAVYVQFLGAAGLVLVCAIWRPISKLLTTRICRWLARVSFSLYLIHVPVLVLVDKIIGPNQEVLTVSISTVVALILAEIFCRFVEQPLHIASRKIGDHSKKVWQREFSASAA